MNKKYIDKLLDYMNNNDMDAMLIVPSEELQFLFGFSPYLCERFQGMFVKKDGEYFYFCNMLTRDELDGILPEEKVFYWMDNDGFIDILKDLLIEKELIGKTIGVNSTARAFNIIDIKEHMDVEFVNGRNVLENIRIIKTEDEIENLKEAGKRTDMVMKEAVNFIKPGITEGQIAEKVRSLFAEVDMTTEFAIICRGKNAAMPHYSGTDGVVEEKDVVLLDIGGKYMGLCSDITRTVFVGGITEEEKKIYEIVLESYNMGTNEAVAGTPAKDVDDASRGVIEKYGYGEYFLNRTGHGIGYSVHEAPYINALNNTELEDGMAFSIEPGIYLKGKFGVRIEDIVVIEKGKPVSVNNFTKDIIVL